MTRTPGSSEALHNIPVALADRLDAEPNPAHHRSRERARGHTALRRVLAGIAFLAVAASGYYAYRETTSEGSGNDATDVATTRIEDAAPAAPSSAAGGADPATGPATPGFGVTERAPDPLPESSRAPSADAPATPPRPDDGIRPRPNANRSTGETPSTLARDGRADAAAPSRRTQAAIDRDALETKRLIARDLAGFMPPGGGQEAPRSPSAR